MAHQNMFNSSGCYSIKTLIHSHAEYPRNQKKSNIEAGFDYVTQKDGLLYFRKRK